MQKTGGSTVDALLRRFYLESQICPERHSGLSRWPKSILAKYDFFSFHGTYEDAVRVSGDKFIFTFLRDPVTRMISYIDYMMSYSDEYIKQKNVYPARILKAEGVEGFFSSEYESLRRNLCNAYAYALGASHDDATNFELMRDEGLLLDRAIQHFDALDFVGISEFTGQSIAGLGSRLNIRLDYTGQFLNKTNENHFSNAAFVGTWPHEFSDIELELVHQHTRLDQRIYEIALARFSRAVDDLYEDYCNLPHTMGEVRMGSFGDEVVVSDGTGIVVCGPWCRLPAGSYTAEFMLSDLGFEDASADPERDWLWLEIACKAGTMIVARRDLTMATTIGKSPVAFQVDFTVVPNVSDYEFRVHKLDRRPVTVAKRVRLRRRGTA